MEIVDWQLVQGNGSLKTREYLKEQFQSNVKFQWFQIVYIITKEWKEILTKSVGDFDSFLIQVIILLRKCWLYF